MRADDENQPVAKVAPEEMAEAVEAYIAAIKDLEPKEAAWWANRCQDTWEPYQEAVWRKNNARDRAYRMVDRLAHYGHV